MHLLVTHDDGTQAAVEVNDSTVLNIKTYAPPSSNEFGPDAFPVMTQDQSFSLQGVVSVALSSQPPVDAVVYEPEPPPLEMLTDAQAAAMEAQAVEGVAPMPWEEG